MDNTTIITVLNNLIQADIDAYYIAHKGLNNVESDEIIHYLAQLQTNHEQRVKDLSEIVRHFGGEPPVAQDFKGYALEGVVALSGLWEQKRVLQCVQSAEESISSLYQKLKELIDKENPVPIEVKNLLDKYWADQQHYLESMEKLLKAA